MPRATTPALRIFTLAAATIFSPSAFAATPCTALNHRTIPAAQIGLPTQGARVTSAHETSSNNIRFCKLRGEILSVDPTAQPIRFELNLPDTWNSKAVQFGGASFDGHVVTGLTPGTLGDKRQPTPLQRGYATFGSDAGHHHHYLIFPDITNAVRADFALNDEQRKNFASEELKKTHDTAVALIRARYDTVPQRMYFLGGSTGGREAMMVVDRWPADYDGVLAAYAAWNQIDSDLQFIAVARALYAHAPDGQRGWLSNSDTRLLHKAVLKSCDAADGLRDGIVSDPAACNFDPQTLACPDGRSHHGCLSTQQLLTVHTLADTFTASFTVANGMDTEPGYNILRGADFTNAFGLVSHPFHRAIPLINSFDYVVADGILRFFLTHDPHFNALTFGPRTASSPGHPEGFWVDGVRKQSAEDDATLADLTPFAAHGGKLLLVHGDSDTVIPTAASVLLYQRITAAMGQPAADSFLRLYLVPGFAHGRGQYDAAFDALGTLDAWATQNNAPANLTVTDQHNNRTRPLCPYPTWPRYTTGNPNQSTSFTCASN